MSDQIAEEQERGNLFPTPSASNANDGEGTETWLARRERVKATGVNGNGMGMPLAIAVKLLPTPTARDEAGSGGNNASNVTLTDAVVRTTLGTRRNPRLLPTPQVADMQGGHAAVSVRGGSAWGPYEPAVRLWESITRPAPAPTLPDGKNGNHRLAAVFPEWMMGYPSGWVTDILSRNPAIKACGNGVVPQQAFAGLGVLWARVLQAVAA